MKKLFKRNQIVITALAAMIAIAGYIQYTGDGVFFNKDLEADSKNVVKDISQEDIYAQTVDQSEALAVTDENGEIFNDTEDNGASNEQKAVPKDGAAAATEEKGGTPGETVLVNSNSVELAAELKLSREQVRSKNKETLMEIINNSQVTDTQKEEAIAKMIEMTEIADSEMAAETLLEAKGFPDAVVTITDGSIDVVINSDSITDEQRAQIEDIVKRKTNIPAEKIVISSIAQ